MTREGNIAIRSLFIRLVDSIERLAGGLVTIASAFFVLLTINAIQAPFSLLSIILFNVPIFDTSLVVISCLSQKRAVYQAGVYHTDYRLVQLRLPSSSIVLIMHLFAIVSGCLVFLALPLPPLWGNLIFAMALLVVPLILTWPRENGSH